MAIILWNNLKGYLVIQHTWTMQFILWFTYEQWNLSCESSVKFILWINIVEFWNLSCINTFELWILFCDFNHFSCESTHLNYRIYLFNQHNWTMLFIMWFNNLEWLNLPCDSTVESILWIKTLELWQLSCKRTWEII